MNNISPIDLREFDKVAANLYEAVVVIGRKARRINDENRLEYNTLVGSLAPGLEDEIEGRDNSELAKISIEMENRPKPHLIALKQLLDGELTYRYKEEGEI